MKTRRKRLGACLLTIAILFSGQSNYAAEPDETMAIEAEGGSGIEYDEYYENFMRNAYIRTCSASLSISGSTATSTGYCSKYTNVSDDITIYIYLQKQSSSTWTTVRSSSTSYTGSSGSKTLTASISRGTYRTKVSCWVSGENVVVTSSSKTY